jgi:flagellar hook-basal body complex protein FliE
MSDPLGLIGGSGGINPSMYPRPLIKGPGGAGAPGAADAAGIQAANAPGASFKDVLLQNLNEVNAAQQDATRAVEDLATGQRTDIEGVILATQKADNAFRMLQALRNKVMDAYEEVKQIRT